MTKKKRAWLIAWEASTAAKLAEVAPPHLLAFVDARRSNSALRDMVFGAYFASGYLTPEEKLALALSPERRRAMRVEDPTCISFGFNPWVVARRVEDITIEVLDDGASRVRWRQYTYRVSEGLLAQKGTIQREAIIPSS